MELKDKVIVITGAARGLGRGMAEEIAAKGAKLALVDMNCDALEPVIAACRARGGDAAAFACNVADEAQVEKLFQDVVNHFGALHGLINNAGILKDGLLVKVSDGKVERKLTKEQWQAVIDVNLTGVFLCGREAAIKMIELGTQGAIINISSLSKAGNMGQSNYSAAKAGVHALAVVWAKELARYGIRAASIAPGFIATEMVDSMKPEAREKMTAGIPLKRMGTPQEIAQSAIFILENDYFTGRCIETDGGLRI